MKSLRESLLDDDLIDKTDEMIKSEIKEFLKQNYRGHSGCKISRQPNSNGKYEVSSTKDIEVKRNNITSLTNGTFVWVEVSGDFNCSYCNMLQDLEGAPEKVKGIFSCINCNSLKTLRGAPKEVGGSFYCSSCKSLESLEGAPKEVGGTFDCSECKSLTSLEEAPKEVGGNFYCYGCKVKFTEDDVEKVSIVERKKYY